MKLCDVRFRFLDPGGPEDYWKHLFYNSFLGGPVYEHSVVEHMRTIAGESDSPVFVDAGAHYGYFTVYMSLLGGQSGKVFSFEPNRRSFEVLAENVGMNKLENVSLHKTALSDRLGMVTLGSSKYLPTFSSEQRKMEYSTDPKRERVNAMPFDEIARAESISPDIVKIDVRGAEGNVIAGMRESLKKVSQVYCELHEEMRSYGFEPTYIIGALQDAGLETLEFRNFRSDHGRLERVSEDLLENPHGRMIYARR